MRNYSDLIERETFEDRFEYLRLSGGVGRSTFGFDRHLNQTFYRSRAWKDIRDYVILRDGGCDLGIEDRIIGGRLLIHHMNPINADEIVSRSKDILDPEYLICVTHQTHNAIHYGDESSLLLPPKQRNPGDTKLW